MYGKGPKTPLSKTVQLMEGLRDHGQGLYTRAQAIRIGEEHGVFIQGSCYVRGDQRAGVLRVVEHVDLCCQEVAPDPEQSAHTDWKPDNVTEPVVCERSDASCLVELRCLYRVRHGLRVVDCPVNQQRNVILVSLSASRGWTGMILTE